MVAKRFPWTHPLSTNAVGMLVGGIIVGALSLATSEARSLPARFLFILGRWTASAPSYALVVMPLVAGALGAVTREEPRSGFFLAGAAIVAVGVYIGALSR